MKTALPILLVASALVVGCGGSNASGPPPQQPLGRADAEAIALQRVGPGSVQQAELENENGRKFWSIDVRPQNSVNLMEVHVDATTGEVLSTEAESPQQEQQEQQGGESKAKK